MTPKAWTPSALGTHLGASFRRLIALRGELLEESQTAGGDLRPVVDRLSQHLLGERDWLQSLQPVPANLTQSNRAHYLFAYGHAITDAAAALTRAVEKPDAPESWERFGVALLAVLAYQKRTADLRG